ncbi:MAG: hypothetical protein UR69_C0002G0200 [Candidatus Moranbacteria bacterium GW2011_GWE2_35_2-]|nr:MAG: hypothetical protein UR69_C0002G0200 [Candidatus Moranbacteria bacterium GW2011_GWE2_35_2-]KKQ22451.1 MAG: hypothetical protein US37_C0002G0076 [Candidatus Moranbacteria bacterium GW2011_GWF2_37_11]KKQ29520.1 MAG: hypothetical protein US44_C0001G0112 [Candidatus Moranbacteria bacterium GW2011_GWD1_37_17]KKQ30610.1 MAG: hypothetical protein US47_C0002G0200 [Candidatus Moranbacteria bacterium GW2011_GWE1_37_24]KKQ48166.1 MAG: hypothetical protein US66_C0001G0030 [Candidatus Moranbacteria 
MYTSWQKTAQQIITEAIGNGPIKENDHLTIIAAKALFTDLQSRPHPSYSNTGFAIAAFIPESVSGNMMQCLAFELLVNGLSGYFQWKSHNGGEFSILNALIHTGIMTAKEAEQPKQFEVYCTHHNGCNYLVMKDDFLSRLTKKWSLPLTNPALGGKKNGRTEEEDQLLERFKRWYPGMVSSDGQARVKDALTRL